MLLKNIERIKADPILRQAILSGYVKYTTSVKGDDVVAYFEYMAGHSRRGCSCQLLRYRESRGLQRFSLSVTLGSILKSNQPNYCKCIMLKYEPGYIKHLAHWWFNGIVSIPVDNYFDGTVEIKWSSVTPYGGFKTLAADNTPLIIPEIKSKRAYFSDNDRSGDASISKLAKNKTILDGVFNG